MGSSLPASAACRFSSWRPTWCTGARPSSSTRCARTTSTCFPPTPACVCEYLWLPLAKPGPCLGSIAGLCCIHVLILAWSVPCAGSVSPTPAGQWALDGGLVGVGGLDLDLGAQRGFGLCPWPLLPLEGIAPMLGCLLCCVSLLSTLGSCRGHRGHGAMQRSAELMGTSPVPRYSPLAEQFSRQFPAHDLPSVLAKFSLPVSLSEFRNPLAPPVQEVSRWSPGSLETTQPVSFPRLRASVLLHLGFEGVGLLCRCFMSCRGDKGWLPSQARPPADIWAFPRLPAHLPPWGAHPGCSELFWGLERSEEAQVAREW